MASKKAGRRWRTFIVLLICVGVAGMVGLVMLLFGSVSGIEFSPANFESRRFTVREIPWLQIQITPIQRTHKQSSTARYLVAQSLIQPAKSSPSDWHLVQLSRGGMSTNDADAKLLTDQLEMHFDNSNSTGSNSTTNEYWHNWSINDPAKAKIFWPIVQKLASRELYILMPRLFSLAVDAQDDQALQQSIDTYLRANYFDLVTEMRNAKRTELADELLAEAMTDYPDDEKLQGLR